MSFNIDDWHKAAGKSHLCSEIVKNETKQDMKGINMKEEALKLADELDEVYSPPLQIASAMIRRLVEELDKQGKPIAWSCCNEDMVDLPAVILFTEPDKYEWQSIKPLYTTPQTKPLSDDEVIIPRELAENYLQVTEVPRFKRILKAILERHGIK